MSGPGGRTIARVSVRVVPDTSGFKSAVEAELKSLPDEKIQVSIDWDVNREELRAKLDEIKESITVTVNFDVDKAALAAQEAAAKDPITVPVNFEVDKGKLDAEKALAAKPVKVPVNFDVDKGALAAEKALAGRPIHVPVEFDTSKGLAGLAFGSILSDIVAAFDQVKASGASAFSTITGSASEFTSGAGAGVIGAVSTLVQGLLRAGATALVFAEAGAAVTAAWGAVSTAIAAVPAAIGLIGAPLATIALGMDGIKKAAQVLAPEFNKLKTAISATFTTGLTPVFNQLKGTLTALTPSIQTVANSLVGLARQTANFITQGGGLKQIETVFNNVAEAVNKIDLVPLERGFLTLAGSKGALDLLVTTVNGLGKALEDISKNTNLESAFSGLSGVVSSLEKAFADLVNNGIDTFSAAAPGAQAAIDGLGSFFNKFDWTRIGGAVGDALHGIGSALDGIPQSTVDGITTAFEGLGTQLNSPAFQQSIQKIAAALPGFIQLLGNLAIGFTEAAANAIEFAGAINDKLLAAGEAFARFRLKVQNSLGLVPKDIQDVGTKAEQAASELARGIHKGIVPNIRPIESEVRTEMNKIPESIKGAAPPVASNSKLVGEAVGPALLPPIQRLIPQVKGAVTDLATKGVEGFRGLVTGAAQESGKVPEAVLNPLRALVGDIPPVGQRVGEGFGNAANLSFADAMATLGTTTQQGFVPLQQNAQTGVQNMAAAVDAAIPGLGTAFATGFTNLGPLVSTAFQALATGPVTTGLAAIGTAITTGFGTNISTAIGTAFLGLNTVFQAGFIGLTTTAVTPGLAALGLAFTTGFATVIAPAIGTAFLALAPVFQAGFISLTTTAITPGLAAMGLAFQTGFATVIGPAIGTAFLGLATVFQAGFISLNATAITPGLAAMGLAFTTGFATVISPAIGQAFLALGTVFQAGFVALAANVAPGMASIAAAVTAGFGQVTAAFTAGFVQAKAACDQGMADIAAAVTQGAGPVVEAVTTMMTNFAKAVTDGGKAAVDAVKKVTQDMKAAIDVNILKSTGLALMQGLAAGINEGSSIVQDAVRKVVADAKKAADQAANVNSPSRLFRDGTGKPISEGIAVGILDRIHTVEDAARKAVQAAIAAAQSQVDASTGFDVLQLQAALSDSLSALSTQVNAIINADTAKPPVANFTHQTILDGKAIESSVETVVGVWEKDILAGQRGA